METNLLIVGALVSLVVQIIKVYAGTRGTKSLAVSVFVSLVAGTAYYLFSYNTALWEAVLQVLVYANAVYAVIIKQLE